MTSKSVTSIAYLRDTFKIGYEAFESSRKEAAKMWDYYHNRHYTASQLAVLENRGQPPETFNVVKLFTRTLLGYYSTVLNSIVCEPNHFSAISNASLLTDAIDHILRDNNFLSTVGEQLKLSAIVSGLACAYLDVEETGEKDEYGRKLRRITIEHVSDSEIVLDPQSRKDDYSDGRFFHRFKWVSEAKILELFGQPVLDKLTAYYNFTYQENADYDIGDRIQETGYSRLYDNYLIVHSIVKDSSGKTYSIYWHDDIILEQIEITFADVKFPYRIVMTHSSFENGMSEYYGIFREVGATQDAINQALLKIQLMLNSQKAFVEKNAVENLAEFTNSFNRVSAVIEVKSLKGIKVENLSREVQDQYIILDKALDRIQRLLGANDSFLGMAYASDSGRKVKLQQNASIISLRYLTGRLEAFYRFLGWDLTNLIKQYYTAHQWLRLVDEMDRDRWVELNRPLQTWTGQTDPRTGQPVMRTEYEEVIDPRTGEPEVDKDGNYMVAPIPDPTTELTYTKVTIKITSVAYNDEDEKNQLLLEQILSGPVGQLLAQVNPAGYFQAAGLSLRSVKTKHSPEISAILTQTAQMLGQSPDQANMAQGMAQAMPGKLSQQGGPSSKTLNLPQNTNEV